MMDEVQNLLEEYWRWLRDKTTTRTINGHLEITTPYLDRHNDCLRIYASQRGNGYLLSDDSYIIDDLEMSGCPLDRGKRLALLKTTLNGFGVRLNQNALEIDASRETFAVRKHNLVQAMLAVNDLFYLASPTIIQVFQEDVATWLDDASIRFIQGTKFTGKSGFDHIFDFVIPKSRTQPERLLKALNHPSRNTAQALAFSWIDTKEVRPPDAKVYAILNDTQVEIPKGVFEALREYDLHPVPWSSRANLLDELAA